MELDMIKRGLRAEIKKREKETYATCQTNVRDMCTDVLSKLEEQEKEIAELKAQLRKTQRALWMARARTAHLEVKCFIHDMYDEDATAEQSAKDEIMADKWQKVKKLCKKKAEEYK